MNTFTRIILVAVLISVLGFLGWFYLLRQPSTAGTTVSTTGTTTTVAPIVSSSVAFEAPPEPVNGHKVLVIVLGISKVFGNEILTDGRNSKFLSSQDYPQLFQIGIGDSQDVKSSVFEFLKKMQDSGGIAPGRVQMVAPSSTKGNPVVEKIKTQLRGKLNVVDTTTDEEGNLAYKSSVASVNASTTTVVDLNPTQCRITYSLGTSTKTVVTTGTNPKDKTVEQASMEFTSAFNSIPASNRQNVVVVWAAMRDILSCKPSRYCQLAQPPSGIDANLDNGFTYLNSITGNKMFDSDGTFAAGYAMKF